MSRQAFSTFVFLVAALAPAGGAAQLIPSDDATLVDRVAAVVGDSVVLLSQVQEEIQRMQIQGRPMPEDPAAREQLFRETLQSWVDRVLVLQAAARDSLIRVDETVIEQTVAQELDRRTQAYGGAAALQAALRAEGLTLGSYREILTAQIRQEQIQRLFMQRQLQNTPAVVVTEAELRAAFADASNQLQQRPRLISFAQVIVDPEPSLAADSATLARAHAIRDSVVAGADFAEMAERYSQDPGSATNGGDLGWFRRGAMVREFEDAAFGLLDGQVSQPIRSEFGYHVIKVERSRPGERKGRHILLIPEQTDEDVQTAEGVAAAVAEQARAGVSMAQLHRTYSDSEAPDTLTVTFDQLEQLPPGYDRLATAAVGDVLGPLRYEAARGEIRFAVLRVRDIREAGAYTFEDVRAQLEALVLQEKQQKRVLDRLRARAHVVIRM